MLKETVITLDVRGVYMWKMVVNGSNMGEKINMMLILMFVIFEHISARATLDKSGHLMFVEYSINEPAKDESLVNVMDKNGCGKAPFIGDFNFLGGE